jgi:stage II sporulation protein D
MIPRRTTRRTLPAAVLLLALAACTDHDPTGPRFGDPGAAPARDVGTAAWNGNIRIGVVPAASSVVIGSDAAWSLADQATGDVLLSGPAGVSATVTLESGSISVTRYRLQVVCAGEAAVADLEARAHALGHPTLREPIAACIRLLIGDFPPDASFSVRNAYRNQLIAEGLAGGDSFWRLITTVTGSTAYRVDTGAEQAVSGGPVVLTSSDSLVRIGGVRYRGVAEVRRNASGSLAGINEVAIEPYLYGVVPHELSPVLWPEVEALKAQSVAARTYALSGLGKRAADGYDLLATTADQVYGGYDAEHPVSSAAVDATAGIVATYGGLLIQALFHSTSGGHTANNEDVFSSAPVPYLRGVVDAERGSSQIVLDSLRRGPAAPNLRGLRNGDYEAQWSRYHRWTFEWSMDEITAVISAFAGQPVGRVTEINVLSRATSGRVTEIEYVTEAGAFRDVRDRIRSSLRYINANGQPANLLSTLFVIDPVLDRQSGEVVGYRAFGGGWGHGVGLSQTGAVGMAARGASFERILSHYYQGIELTHWY